MFQAIKICITVALHFNIQIVCRHWQEKFGLCWFTADVTLRSTTFLVPCLSSTQCLTTVSKLMASLTCLVMLMFMSSTAARAVTLSNMTTVQTSSCQVHQFFIHVYCFSVSKTGSWDMCVFRLWEDTQTSIWCKITKLCSQN